MSGEKDLEQTSAMDVGTTPPGEKKDLEQTSAMDVGTTPPGEKEEDDYLLKLQKQTILHRNIIFYSCLILAVVMYVFFCVFISIPGGLFCLLNKTSLAVAIGTLLCLVPTTILITLLGLVYKAQKPATSSEKVDEEVSRLVDLTSKLANIYRAVK